MKFCQYCGRELLDDARFCEACGKPAGTDVMNCESDNDITEQVTTADFVEEKTIPSETDSPVKQKKRFALPKKAVIAGIVAVAVLLVAGIIVGRNAAFDSYKTTLENAYNYMDIGADLAEGYTSLQTKVWYNSIYERSSTETDKYTMDENGVFYSDFNDALSKFYVGESYRCDLLTNNMQQVETFMAELRDCPEKYEDEYMAVKGLYIAYSGLADLVLGSSSYSYNTLNEAFEGAKSDYKSAESSVRLLLG